MSETGVPPGGPAAPEAASGAASGAAPAGDRHFPIRVGRRTRWLLLLWGVWSPERAEVALEGDQVRIRFGFFGARIAIADVDHWDVDGPYVWVRAIAVRHTWFKQDISFLGDGGRALRLFLKSGRRIAWVRGCNLVYVGVQDLDGFGAELVRRGIPQG